VELVPSTGDEKWSRRQAASYLAVYVVAGAVAPRIVFFDGRLRGRALVAVTAGCALLKFAALQWPPPWGERHEAQRDAARAKLTAELGRKPTIEELVDERYRNED